MGSPSYDSSRPGSFVSICCNEKEQLDEVTRVEPKNDTVWDEELSVTLSRDDEDMIYEDPMEQNMIFSSPYEASDEERLNPFATIIEYETSPDVANRCHMRMIHYD